VVVDASGCQLPLAPLVNISLSPGKILSASVVSLSKLEWDDVAVHPEPQTARARKRPQKRTTPGGNAGYVSRATSSFSSTVE